MGTGADIPIENDEFSYEDYCYECTGYGDDYYLNEDGELVSACDDCPFNYLHYEE